MAKRAKDTILIVDNNADAIKLYKLIFRDIYDICIASSTHEAFHLIMEQKIKVVLADYYQTDGSVIDLFEQIANTDPNIQRILVTTHSDNQLILEGINRGRIFNFMRKPFDPKHLKMIVQKAIDQYLLNEKNQLLLKKLQKRNETLTKLLNDLKSEEEKFRNIFNASPDPVFIVDTKGGILQLNEKAQQNFEANLQSEGNGTLMNLVAGTDKLRVKAYLKDIWGSDNGMIEVKMATDDGEWHDYEINSFPVKFHGLEAGMVTLRDLSERKETEKLVLQSIIQTEEKERRRFAQELHDGIGPLLSTTKLYLQWFNKPNARMDKGVIINKMEETLEETIASLREVSNNISPNTLMNFGLNTALKTFINRVRNASDISFKYKCDLKKRLPSEIEVSVYRLICESINNSIKHAEADTIGIRLTDKNEYLSLVYKDNGKGFVVAKKLTKGSGLMNMKTRVQSLGGQINIESTPGKGMKIKVQLMI